MSAESDLQVVVFESKLSRDQIFDLCPYSPIRTIKLKSKSRSVLKGLDGGLRFLGDILLKGAA